MSKLAYHVSGIALIINGCLFGYAIAAFQNKDFVALKYVACAQAVTTFVSALVCALSKQK